MCISSFGRIFQQTLAGNNVSDHSWLTWESALEVVVGGALCMETLSTLWLLGRKAFFRDCWCLVDATVAFLTLAQWVCLVARRAMLAAELLEANPPLLALRFALQPLRFVAAFSMVRRVRNMQQITVDIAFDNGEECAQHDDTSPDNNNRILTPELRAKISAHLPSWCRFRQWNLTYAPCLHGFSTQTFYRRQTSSSSNVILIREARDGHILGAFATERWRASGAGGYHGTPECFVFSTHIDAGMDVQELHDPPESEMAVFHVAPGLGTTLLWGDASSFSIGGAISVRDDFRAGSTSACPVFSSPALLPSSSRPSDQHVDFIVQDFECWQLGGVADNL